MEESKLTVVWTGASTINATDCKVGPMHSVDVDWELYQKRRGLVRRLLPLPTFLYGYLPGNEWMVCDKLGIERCSHDELVERYKTGEFHDAKEPVEPAPAPESLEDRTNAELQDLLRDRGLPIYGAKADLIERLENN